MRSVGRDSCVLWNAHARERGLHRACTRVKIGSDLSTQSGQTTGPANKGGRLHQIIRIPLVLGLALATLWACERVKPEDTAEYKTATQAFAQSTPYIAEVYPGRGELPRSIAQGVLGSADIRPNYAEFSGIEQFEFVGEQFINGGFRVLYYHGTTRDPNAEFILEFELETDPAYLCGWHIGLDDWECERR